jgi:hypothetical protein
VRLKAGHETDVLAGAMQKQRPSLAFGEADALKGAGYEPFGIRLWLYFKWGRPNWSERGSSGE